MVRARATERKSAAATFAGENGRAATHRELAESLGWTEEEVEENVLAEHLTTSSIRKVSGEGKGDDELLDILEFIAISEEKPGHSLMQLSSFFDANSTRGLRSSCGDVLVLLQAKHHAVDWQRTLQE
ncbi:MAG: sigma-70 domain-containing protein [Planctomycetota bacterium]